MTERVARHPLRFRYRNHRGEVAWREVWPQYVWWGNNDWHPGEQWFLHACDNEKDDERDFAVADILEFEPAVEMRTASGECVAPMSRERGSVERRTRAPDAEVDGSPLAAPERTEDDRA